MRNVAEGRDPPDGVRKAVPPAPMPQDEQGWRVAPAPDGRGMPEQHQPRPPHRLRGFWIFVLVLLAVNWLSVLIARPGSQPRVTVPFSPYFLNEVNAGQVKSIASSDNTIAGTFSTKLRYPPNDSKATPTTLFKTVVPAFWDHATLTKLLQSEGVQVNATAPKGTSVLAEILLGFGPTLLLVGLFLYAARRAAASGGGMGALGGFGRSRARRIDPQSIRVTFEAVAGIDEAEGDAAGIVAFLRRP